jgi:anti-sigma regulatory factor (Ser/Thr protein kinase)
MEIAQQVVRVGERSQAGDARRAAMSIAQRIGFDDSDAGRVGLVVTEAATNLVKHAKDGEIVLTGVRENDSRRVRILAMDQGPGIRRLEECLRDGFSSVGSLGTGLGAIRRSSSEFDIYTGADGTIVYSMISSDEPKKSHVLSGAVCAPHPAESACGDGFVIVHGSPVTRVLLVDGLGHGPGAAEAAEAAIASFRAHPGDSPADALERMQVVLRPTRGAAVAVARLDRGSRVARFSGIGNIAGVVMGEAEPARHMVSDHGIVGQTSRGPREFDYPLPPRFSVVFHSDGITARWKLETYPGLMRRHPMLAAGVLFRDFRRPNDDATVLVLREAA